MSESILNSVKNALDVPESIVVFDGSIKMHINSIFATLNQLGIGPELGFMIEGDTETWDAFLGDDLQLNSVKTYVFGKVKLLFDPPQTSYLITALEKQIEEFEWRISVKREGEEWVDPNPVSVTSDE